MRKLFYILTFSLLVLIGVLGILDHRAFRAYAVVLPLFALGIYNMVQPRHTIP